MRGLYDVHQAPLGPWIGSACNKSSVDEVVDEGTGDEI